MRLTRWRQWSEGGRIDFEERPAGPLRGRLPSSPGSLSTPTSRSACPMRKLLLLAACFVVTCAPVAQARPVYLTFDDGPGRYTDDVLDILDRFDVPATFFMCGQRVQAHRGKARRVVRNGHRIGNHSWDHQDFWDLDAAQEQRELARTQRVIRRELGVTPTLMRPPFGHADADTDAANTALGLSLVDYDVSPRDWDHQSGVTADQIAQRTLSGIDEGGSVVLLHDAECRYPYLNFPEQTISALPRIIRGLKRRGHTLRRWPAHRAFTAVREYGG